MASTKPQELRPADGAASGSTGSQMRGGDPSSRGGGGGRLAAAEAGVGGASGGREEQAVSSAACAIAAAIGAASSKAVRVLPDSDEGEEELFSAPSEEFLGLCRAQLELCSRLLACSNCLFSVFVRTPASYASGVLKLRRVAVCGGRPEAPGRPAEPLKEVVVFADASDGAADADTTEMALAEHEAVELPERRALVLPIARAPFVLGLLVIERPRDTSIQVARPVRLKPVRPLWPPRAKLPASAAGDAELAPPPAKLPVELSLGAAAHAGGGPPLQPSGCNSMDALMAAKSVFLASEQAAAAQVARTLALACVMDQRALLLQRSAWQTGVHMDGLLEEFRGPLMAFRTLGRMLLPQLRQGELSKDLVDDMLSQGDRMKEVVQQLQNALYPPQPQGSPSHDGSRPPLSRRSEQQRLTVGSAALVGESYVTAAGTGTGAIAAGGPPNSEGGPDGTAGGSLAADCLDAGRVPPIQQQQLLLAPLADAPLVGGRDQEMTMPPLALAAVAQQWPSDTAGSNVLDLVADLVLLSHAFAAQRGVQLQHSATAVALPLVAADSTALRQAISDAMDPALQLTQRGGWVRVEVAPAPGGGVLVIVEDNGPGNCLVSPARKLAPVGATLGGFALDQAAATAFESSVKGLSLARDSIESMGGVVRVQSPHLLDAPRGYGGTRVELWLPAVGATGACEASL